MALKGHPKGCASNHVSTLSGKSMGYADGGSVGHVNSQLKKKADKPTPTISPKDESGGMYRDGYAPGDLPTDPKVSEPQGIRG